MLSTLTEIPFFSSSGLTQFRLNRNHNCRFLPDLFRIVAMDGHRCDRFVRELVFDETQIGFVLRSVQNSTRLCSSE